MSNGHARLGPSNKRWPHCPGSVREEAEYEDIAGAAAVDGTGSHLLLEMCLDNNVPAISYDMQIIGANHPDNPNGWLIDPDRCERVQMCLDYISGRVKMLRNEFDGAYSKINVEAEGLSDPGGAFGRDDWWGTCDITITVINKHDRCLFMETVDYKDGRMWVGAEDNTQLISYLGGKLRPYFASGPDLVRPFHPQKIGKGKMTIVQPKTSPPVRSSTITGQELIEKLENLAVAAYETDKPDAPMVSDGNGKGHCRWCKHRKNCTAGTKQSVEEMENMNTEITASGDGLLTQSPADLQLVPADELVKVADTKAGILEAYSRIDDEIERRLLAGEPVNGYAMVAGNNSQVYSVAEEEIVKALKGRRMKKDQIYPAKLITPAALMKSSCLDDNQKERFKKDFITIKVGNDRMTRVAYDKDEPAPDAVEQMFGDVTTDSPDFTEAAPEPDFSQAEEPVSFF